MFVKISKKGGARMKNCLTFHDITKQNICMLVQREIFAKFAIKSTIFELQQSYLHIFGVARNFQLNGGAVAPPPPKHALDTRSSFKKNPIKSQFLSYSKVIYIF